MAYKVKLDLFEGPLDLLLHLIKKSEVDIYDIPIATITEQYLEYLDILKTLNLDIVGEYLLMAATLIHIKSKTLLPAPEESGGDDDEEVGDPREELVKRLLEYQRYKDASKHMYNRNLLGRDVFTVGHVDKDELGKEDEFKSLSIFSLIDTLQTVLKKAPADTLISIPHERFSIVDKIDHIMQLLSGTRSATFISFFHPAAPRVEIVVTFLAILELAKMRMIRLYETDDGTIRVYLPDLSEEDEAGVISDEVARVE